jgi:hypothetical protein
MATYETELLARVVALQKEAMASINVRCDAVPYFFHVQEAFPYFTNRISANPVSDEGSEDLDVNRPLVIMRLIVGHITEGYKGQPESKLYEWGPLIKTYFQRRTNWLRTASGPYATRVDNLISARMIDSGGFRIFQDSGIGATTVGRELQLQCEFSESIEQVYY